MDVDIYGAFRSGTNYVKAILELNYDIWVRPWGGGFKHAPVPALFDSSGWVPRRSIGVVKDPWSWLPSLFQYATGPGSNNFQCSDDWDLFLVEPLILFSGALEGFPHYWYRTPIDYWTAMAVSFGARETALVSYEEALQAPLETCDALASIWGAARTTTDFVVPPNQTLRAGDGRFASVDDSMSNNPFDRTHYEDRRYMSAYSAENITVVNSLLVDDIVTSFGYAQVS